MEQTKIMSIVEQICNIPSTNCRGLNKAELAKELLNLANVPNNAIIKEIPVSWSNQVVILFTVPKDQNYYSLFTGIGKDDRFCFELSITGILKGNRFNFFDHDIPLNLDYFKKA